MKPNYLTRIAISSLLLISITPLFAGGPWTQAKGGGFAQLSFTTILPYDGLFLDGSDNLSLQREVRDNTLLLYGEYGLRETLTLGLELPFKQVSSADQLLRTSPTPALDAGDLTRLGNTALFLKQRLYSGKFVLSGSVKLELPAGEIDSLTGLASGYDAVGVTPGVAIGFSGHRYYASADIGLRFRNNSLANDILINGEAGWQALVSRLWLIGVLDIRQGISDATAPGSNLRTGLYPDGQEWFAFGVKALLDITPALGISVASFGASGGNLVASSPSYTGGIYLRF